MYGLGRGFPGLPVPTEPPCLPSMPQTEGQTRAGGWGLARLPRTLGHLLLLLAVAGAEESMSELLLGSPGHSDLGRDGGFCHISE